MTDNGFSAPTGDSPQIKKDRAEHFDPNRDPIEELAAELFGTWDLVELEVMMMTMDCPGVMGIGPDPDDTVECSAGFVTFNADGTYFSIETTDALGNPSNLRTEGTWSTDGNILTTTDTHEGPDGGTLDPIDPPESSDVEWSISGNTLSITITDRRIPDSFILRWEKR